VKIVAIIQVRDGSTRLPGKAFLPLAGLSMTENIIRRVKRSQYLDDVCLAVPFTGTPADDKLETLAYDCDIAYCCPELVDENDLVSRYMAAALATQATIIVRVPGDNPCVDPAYIDKAVGRYLRGHEMFYTNTTDLVGGFGYVDGVGAEVLNMDQLEALDRETIGNSIYREHLHKWFEDTFPDVRLPKAKLRLDVNTQEDYNFVKNVYDYIGHNRFTACEAVEVVSGLQRSSRD